MIDNCWLRLSKKFECLLHVVWRNESKRGKTADVAANFVVDFVLRLQSYLVHFANVALTEVEITVRHGRVWIRSTESAHSSFLEIHQESKIVRGVARGI